MITQSEITPARRPPSTTAPAVHDGAIASTIAWATKPKHDDAAEHGAEHPPRAHARATSSSTSTA